MKSPFSLQEKKEFVIITLHSTTHTAGMSFLRRRK